MKKFNIFALMLAMVVSMVSMNSCSKDDGDGAPEFEGAVAYSGELVGTWSVSEEDEDETYTSSITFYNNGTFVSTNSDDDGWYKYSGIFSVSGDELVTITMKVEWKYDESLKDYLDEGESLSGSETLDADEMETDTCIYKVESGKLYLCWGTTFSADDAYVLTKK